MHCGGGGGGWIGGDSACQTLETKPQHKQPKNRCIDQIFRIHSKSKLDSIDCIIHIDPASTICQVYNVPVTLKGTANFVKCKASSGYKQLENVFLFNSDPEKIKATKNSLEDVWQWSFIQVVPFTKDKDAEDGNTNIWL